MMSFIKLLTYNEIGQQVWKFIEAWREASEELSDLYCLPNFVRVVKSRRMRWAGHVARMGER
jgi:hypothetical protein